MYNENDWKWDCEMGSIFEDLFLRKSDLLDKIFFSFFVNKTGKVILDACYMLNR